MVTKATGNARGGPRKPARVAALAGVQRKPPPVIAPAVDTPPDDMNEEQAGYWRQYAPALIKLNRLTELSEPCLIALCRWSALVDRMHARLDAEGLTQIGQRGEQIKHHLLGPLMAAENRVDVALNQLGMTPAAHERFAPVGEPDRRSSADLLEPHDWSS